VLELATNVLLQALTFGIAAVGVAIAFRVIRYPDLTIDGSFMLGSSVFAATIAQSDNWVGPLVLSLVVGAAAGTLTSLLNVWFGVTRLLSGILTTMIAYSIAFRLLDGRSNIGISATNTMFAPPLGWSADQFAIIVAAIFALAAAVIVRHLLQSELGLVLRAVGGRPEVVQDHGRSPAIYQTIGLAAANALVGLSGALVSAQQGFTDINLGVGVVITLIAALVLGEELLGAIVPRHRAPFSKRTIAPFVGMAVYFLLYLLILRASIQGWIPIPIQPTDLKLLSALLVIAVVFLRRRTSDREEILPL
jgi:putative ABC transport system permease protein